MLDIDKLRDMAARGRIPESWLLPRVAALRALAAKLSAVLISAAQDLKAIDARCIQEAVHSDTADLQAALLKLQAGDDTLRARLLAVLAAAEQFGREAVPPQILLVLAGLSKGDWRHMKSPAFEGSGLEQYQAAFIAAATCALDRAEVDHGFSLLPTDPRQLRTGGAAPAAGAMPAAAGPLPEQPARPGLPGQPRAAHPVEAAAASPFHVLRKALRAAYNSVLGPHLDGVDPAMRSQWFCLYTDWESCVVEEGETLCKRALTPGSSEPYCTRMRTYLRSWPCNLPMAWAPNVDFNKKQLLAVAKVLLTDTALADLRPAFLEMLEPALRRSARFVGWQHISCDQTPSGWHLQLSNPLWPLFVAVLSSWQSSNSRPWLRRLQRCRMREQGAQPQKSISL